MDFETGVNETLIVYNEYFTDESKAIRQLNGYKTFRWVKACLGPPDSSVKLVHTCTRRRLSPADGPTVICCYCAPD